MKYTGQALVYRGYGDPEEVLRLEERTISDIAPNQVLVKRLASVIHPSDFGKIRGTYERLSQLPAVAGREGIGEICEVGKAVENLKCGAHVRIPEDVGTWQDYCVLDENDVICVPAGLSIETAAQTFINPPTALRLLNDFVPLRSGDWVVQNAANSCVGRCVIQLAKVYGYKTINVVRDVAQAQSLMAMGANCVIRQDALKSIRNFTDGALPVLALNSVGGESALELIKALADNGTMVTFGAMTSDKVRFPTRELIFKNIQLRGFWMDRWIRLRPKLEYNACLWQIFSLLQSKKLVLPCAETYPLSQWQTALEKSQQSNLNGKILFV
jgi:NADPH:quinone reductase and related Zn-dependent oxidoreductases